MPWMRTWSWATDRAKASKSACASISIWLYWSDPNRAACSLSCNSVMRWRKGSSSRSICKRRSSLARSLVVKSSYSLRLAPSVASRSDLSASAACNPACAATSDRRCNSSSACACCAAMVCICCCAVSMARLSSAWRLTKVRRLKSASWAWRSKLRNCSRASSKRRWAAMAWSSSWA